MKISELQAVCKYDDRLWSQISINWAWFYEKDCHALAKQLGFKRPAIYDLGYPNNNCVGCTKGGMGVLE